MKEVEPARGGNGVDSPELSAVHYQEGLSTLRILE